MRPEQFTPSLRAVLLGSLLVVASAATGVTAAAQPAAPDAQHAVTAQTNDTADNETAEDVIESFQQRVANAETISVTVVTETTSGDETYTSTTSLWVDYANNRSRTEHNSTYGESITVSNETGTVAYDVEDNSVRTDDRTFSENAPDFSLERQFNRSEATLVGQETVDGQEAYRLELEPEMADDDTTITLWLNTTTHLPVQYEMSRDSEYGSYEMTADFDNVSINETFEDDLFTIDVPDDAEREEETDWSFTSYDSLDELAENTSSPVTEAELPGNYSFASGYVSEGSDYSTVTVTYENGDHERVSISETDGTSYNYSQSDRFESVDIGNQTGWYAEYDYGNTTTAMLTWECGDSRYVVYGDLTQSESTDIAESVPCE